jgi:hypothetical protein
MILQLVALTFFATASPQEEIKPITFAVSGFT